METTSQEPVLVMLKTLADDSRLALLRHLALNEQTVGDLARLVDLGEPTVSYHLAKLRAAGFVTLRMAGSQRFYRLNQSGLDRFKQLIAEVEAFPPKIEPSVSDDRWITALGWSEADQRVLRDHTENGRLVRWPNQQKKLFIILRWLATLFAPERRYSEKEINEILKAVYEEDYVSLRRDLVDMGYLRRERGGGRYWLAEDESSEDQAASNPGE